MIFFSVLVAPAVVGPAWGPVVDRLGAMQTHLCKCGMRPGRCGCPECERVERARVHARAAGAAAVITSRCDDDAPAVRFAGLPMGAIAAGRTDVLAPAVERVSLVRSVLPRSTLGDAPPTPPPRSTAV